MRTFLHLLGWLLLVAAALVGLPLLLAVLLPTPAGDANIGAGLAAFAALVGVATVGGFVEGRRLGLPRAASLWLVPAALVAVTTAYRLATEEGGFDAAMFRTELPGTGLFLSVLTLVPAVVGAAVAQGLGTAPDWRHEPDS